MGKYNDPLLAGNYYHIYNHGNNKEIIFYLKKNYKYFLDKYYEYLFDYLDTYAYSLLPNHFHFLVKVKEEPSTTNQAKSHNILNSETSVSSIWSLKCGNKILKEPDKIISELFRRFFTSYSKSINIQERRMGSLFMKNFKRKEVTTEDYLLYLIYYIHYNPEKHKIVKEFRKYPYNSYKSIISNDITKINKKEVIGWFRGLDEFISFHDELHDIVRIDDLIIEE